MSVITINNLKKSYGKNLVLDIPSMQFEDGMSVGIFGANGSGKSTLIKCITSLLPYDGEILIDGLDLKKDPSPLKNIGVLIEDAALIKGLSGRDNIKYFCKDCSTLDEYAKILDVEDILDIKARKYSIGMRQKIAILLACVKGKNAILLDEPFNGLDVISVEKAIDLLLLCRQRGATVLLTSHQLEISGRAVDMYYLLKDKKIFNCTSPQKGAGNRYALEFHTQEDAKRAYDILTEHNIECTPDKFSVKVQLSDGTNIYSILPLIQDVALKHLEDITYSLKEAYLQMEEGK